MIRPLTPADLPALDAFFERNGGNPWAFPDPRHPHTVQVYILEEEGQIKAAMAGVTMVEVCLALDRKDGSTPAKRLHRARSLIEEGCRWAYSNGFTWAYTPVPKEIAGWARKLRKLVGVKDDDRIHGILDLRERFEWSLSSSPAGESKASA